MDNYSDVFNTEPEEHTPTPPTNLFDEEMLKEYKRLKKKLKRSQKENKKLKEKRKKKGSKKKNKNKSKQKQAIVPYYKPPARNGLGAIFNFISSLLRYGSKMFDSYAKIKASENNKKQNIIYLPKSSYNVRED